MPNYPCPPVGFQFTEDNVEQAKDFYSAWLEKIAIGNHHILGDVGHYFVSYGDLKDNGRLPWTVLDTFTETPLPEGETHA